MSQTNDNVLLHPRVKFDRSVKGLQHYDTSKFVRLFVEAVEEGYPREGLVRHIVEDRMHAGIFSPTAQDFIAWCRAIWPHIERPSDRVEAEEPSAPPPLPEDLERQCAAKLREAAGRILASDTFDLERWIEAGDEQVEAFLAWQRDHCPTVATTGVGAAEAYCIWTDERMQAMQDKSVEAAAEALGTLIDADEERKSKGESHRYWHFAPAWQVDSAFWQDHFGADDPALTIAFYFKNAFKSPIKVAEKKNNPSEPKPRWLGTDDASLAEIFRKKQADRTTAAMDLAIERELNFCDARAEPYRLHDEDLSIMRWVLEAYSRNLVRSSHHQQPKAPQAVLLRALISTSGWGEWIEGGLTWRNEDFIPVCKRLPDWLYELVRSDWEDLEYDGCDPILTDREKTQRTKHVRFFADLLIAYASSEIDPSTAHLQRNYTDDEISMFIGDLTENKYDDDIAGIREEVVAAIVRGRQTVFGGVLPFTAEDVSLRDLDTGDGAPWLARLDWFLPERVGGSESPLWVFVPYWRRVDQTGGRRTDPRAMERLSAFKSCLIDMQNEGLNDLATAWWAFFVATQPLAFNGFGLPALLIKEIAAITAQLSPHPGIEKALRLALGVSARSAHPLEARAIVTHLKPLLPSNHLHVPDAKLADIAVAADVAERYLIKKIGAKTWSRLHSESQQDLIKAEQLWSVSFSELGYRKDWGALITIYMRAIECEVRATAHPIFMIASQKSLLTGSDPTLGACFEAARKLIDFMRKNENHDIEQSLQLKIKSFHAIMNPHRFVAGVRNRANHANRDQPITDDEFLKFRNSIFSDALLEQLTKLREKD